MNKVLILLLVLVILGGCVPGENKTQSAQSTCSGLITLWSCNITQTTQADEVAGWLALLLAIGSVVIFWVIVIMLGRRRKPQQ